MKISGILSLFLLLGSIMLNAQADIKVGDIFTFDDSTKGVVFYVDEDGHGLAVSFNQEKRRWEDESNYVYCQDIVGISNERMPSFDLHIGLGQSNTAFILGQLGEKKPSAAKFCREEGLEWYLPTVAEIYKLFEANANGEIGDVLKDNNGKKITKWYWTSSEYDEGMAWRINKKGKTKKTSKLALRVYARAIRQF